MGLFGTPRHRSVALIDIGSASVGGGYAHFVQGQKPVLYYTTRALVAPRDDESITDAMLRALDEVGTCLIEEGAPALRRETGSGHVDQVLVSVAAPWQDTQVVTKNIQEDRPFTFTHALLNAAAQDVVHIAPGRKESGRTVIATVLNGYETADPFGKRAKRAEVVILSSTIETTVAALITKNVRRIFHAHAIELLAFAPVAYAVFRDLFPHQKDFLLLDVSGTATDLAFVKRGLLTEVASVPHGLNALLDAARRAGGALPKEGGVIDAARNTAFGAQVPALEQAWLAQLREVMSTFAANHALPRTLFLLADDNARDFLKRMLDGSTLRTLWLSDEPLSIIPILPSHLGVHVKSRGMAEGDVFLALLALYENRAFGNPAPVVSPTP